MLCPCGSTLPLELCCSPIISQQARASTPEVLMRSRYTAYALNKADYIYSTYASATRQTQSIEDICNWAKQTKWLSLTVHQTKNSSPYPSVLFTAVYIHDNKHCSMTEESRFVMEDDCWFYLDGDIKEHKELATVKRNDPCPCQSKKKFKHCCGR